MAKTYQQIYLSPHYDDAALSCGGTIHQQTQAGQAVLVITICAAPPPPKAPLSPFAEALHRAWDNPDDVVATRRAEDERAMTILGTDYHYLDLTDCIYRGDGQAGTWYYTSEADLFGTIHPADLDLAVDIAERMAALLADSLAALIHAPLTVGHHVDHQLVHLAALHMRQQGWPIIFYEDYPYSDPNYPFTRSPLGEENLHTLEATLATMQTAQPLQPHFRFLTAEDLQAKIDSIGAYESQLGMLFGGAAAMARHVQAYTLSVGQGRPAERVWQPG